MSPVLALLLLAPAQSPAWIPPTLAAVDAKVATELPNLLDLYYHLHANPELSFKEVQSSARMAKELKAVGFTVTEGVGGTGVVGVLTNGPGPTVLFRADMDALPVTERTGLSYASKVRTTDKNGNDVGVMHACGHDVHMTCFVGVARTLTAMKDKWSGTLVLVAQPAEEIGAGAKAMFEAGLYARFPKPDFALALHADSLAEVGTIRYSEGLAMANVDSVDVTVKGKGGHGAAPHTTVDPIVLSARIILDLQTIVSRETNPTDPAVVTVGSIHGGTKHNIIPNEVKLQITVRTTTDKVRDHTLKAIERIIKAAAVGANAPAPEMSVRLDEFTPALLNDPTLTRKTIDVLKEVLGPDSVKARAPVMGGEDFSRFSQGGTPVCMYFIGTIPKDRFEDAQKPGGKPLPSTHNDGYAPAPEGSVRHGVRTMSMSVLNLLTRK